MINVEELLGRALDVQNDLEILRQSMEHSSCPPAMKSSMARNIMESQARVSDVIRTCAAYPAGTVRPAA